MLDKYLVKNPKTASRIIDGEAVVVTPQDSVFHTLNPVATQIWQWIDGKTRVSDIVERLYQEFDVERDVVEKDCLDFVNEAVRQNMVIASDQPNEVVR